MLFIRLAVISTLLCGCDRKKPHNPSTQAAPSIVLSFGQTEKSVREMLGEPDGWLVLDDGKALLYSGEQLEFRNGSLINPVPNIRERIESNKVAIAKRAAHRAAQVRFKKFFHLDDIYAAKTASTRIWKDKASIAWEDSTSCPAPMSDFSKNGTAGLSLLLPIRIGPFQISNWLDETNSPTLYSDLSLPPASCYPYGR